MAGILDNFIFTKQGLHPAVNLLEQYAPTRRDYNIQVNADLAIRNLRLSRAWL
jgi:hypothetical protein